jgi:hypothetical protein
LRKANDEAKANSFSKSTDEITPGMKNDQNMRRKTLSAFDAEGNEIENRN